MPVVRMDWIAQAKLLRTLAVGSSPYSALGGTWPCVLELMSWEEKKKKKKKKNKEYIWHNHLGSSHTLSELKHTLFLG